MRLSELDPQLLPPGFDPLRATRTLEELGETVPDNPAFRALLTSVAANSSYLARLMIRERGFLSQLAEADVEEVLRELNAHALAAAHVPSADSAMRHLRVAKRRLALSLALADISGLMTLGAVTEALSRFAEAATRGALRFLLREATRKAGLPERDPEELEADSGLIVLGMGKLGGFELNYSSDIDLVVFYDQERFRLTLRGDQGLAAVDLVKGLLRSLSETTADGYVFRVDLRLRPDAGATQVAVPTSAAESYYESMGQNWERAAMIKARAVAGDPVASDDFVKHVITPFVWRRNLDYAAIEDIHSIKRQIHTHGGHERVTVLGHNIKLGRGGIREIEFFAQTQQLILGGRDPSLRNQTTLGALAALRARGLISPEAERELGEAYVFLRMLEHRLQMIDDQQTHALPKSPDGLDHIARFCGYADTHAFEDTLLAHMNRVVANYARLFEQEASLSARSGSLVFTGVEDDPETIATLSGMGFKAPSDIAATIRGWHHGRIRATRSARARELLTKLMPALLDALARTADPQRAFLHFDRLLSGLPAGVQLFSLLVANPELLTLIAEVVGLAPRLAEYLGRNPRVLDALIDPEFLTRLPSAGDLESKIATEIERLPGYEGALDAVRRFTREEIFRVGVQIIRGTADAERAGPAYANIAERVIEALQPVVEAEMAAAHGSVPGGAFAVVAQGKLGGREMTAGSDLDLVFLYTHDEDADQSDGPRKLAPSAWFSRASQRFIAALTSATGEGRLYDVDMRLRPSGNQGPVAVRLDSFAQYHREKSWTWEKLALTRARVLSGPPHLRASAEAVIRESLTRAADCGVVLGDARAMREKLAGQFPSTYRWDLKFAAGGLVDLEFIAQSLQLCHAATSDVLDQNTIGAFSKLERAGVLASSDAETLIAAARLQHALTQVLRIALEGTFKPESASLGLKALLMRAADAKSFEALENRLEAAQKAVRGLFERFLPPA
jgi:glutamate-ammonia-ligase adenylyltransferase